MLTSTKSPMILIMRGDNMSPRVARICGSCWRKMRKLRWIGRESEAEKILAVLDVRRRRKASSRQRRANRL
jgi:hypothetical protein